MAADVLEKKDAAGSITNQEKKLLDKVYLEYAKGSVPYILALSAASFIYIAMADLFPALHKRIELGHSIRQLFLILAGIGTILLFHHS